MHLPDAGTRDGRLRWAAGAAVVAAVLAVSWYGWSSTRGQVVPEVTGYEVVSDASVVVDYTLSRPTGVGVVCRVAALDVRKGRVGVVEDRIPADGPAVVARETTVRTSSRAVTGVVESCTRVPGDPS